VGIDLPANFRVFEKLVNVVHQAAPQRGSVSTLPGDTAAAVQRWL
jgi:hypothetical protein